MKRLLVAIQGFLQRLRDAIMTSRRLNLAAGFIAAGVVVAAIAVVVTLGVSRRDNARVLVTEPKPRPLTENAAIPPLTPSTIVLSLSALILS